MPDILAAAAVFLLAGLVKGVVGLGLPTVAMGLLALFLAPAEAAALLLLPSLVTNFVQVGVAPGLAALLRLMGPLLLGTTAGTLAGFALWGGVGGRGAEAALGVALLAYAGLGLTGWRPRLPRGAGGVAGAATGLVTAATGVFILPAVPWLQSQGLAKDALVRAMGIAFTVSTLALGVGLAGIGRLPVVAVGGSALALGPALAGLWLGGLLRGRLSEAGFRRALFLGLAALGAHALWRGLS
jgi:uncharacterized membrane protein YfcA